MPIKFQSPLKMSIEFWSPHLNYRLVSISLQAMVIGYFFLKSFVMISLGLGLLMGHDTFSRVCLLNLSLRPPYPVNEAYQLPPIQYCFITVCVGIKPSQIHGPISEWFPLSITACVGKLSCLLLAISKTICTTVRYQPVSRRARSLVLNLIELSFNLAE